MPSKSAETAPAKADTIALLRMLRDIALDEERTTVNRIEAARVYLDYWACTTPDTDTWQDDDKPEESLLKRTEG